MKDYFKKYIYRLNFQRLFILSLLPFLVITSTSCNYKKGPKNISEWKLSGPYGGRIKLMSFSPNYKNDGVILAITSEDEFDVSGLLYRTQNKGKSWKRIKVINNASAVNLSIHNNKTEIIVGTGNGFLYKSKDGGKSWQKTKLLINNKKVNSAIRTIKFSPEYSKDKTILLSVEQHLENSLLQSTDSGLTWKEVKSFSSYKDFVILDIKFSNNYQNDKTISIKSYYSEYFKSTDRGLTWKLMSPKNKRFTESSTIYSPDFNYEVIIHLPFKRYIRNKIEISTDWGKNWKAKTFGINDDITKVQFSPNYLKDKSVFIVTSERNIYKVNFSNHKVFKLRKINTGYERGEISDLFFSPDYNETGSFFVATNEDLYAYNQQDEWIDKTKGIAERGVNEIAIPNDYSKNETIFVATENYLFKSFDKGKNWTKIKTPDDFNARGGQYLLIPSPDFSNDRTIFLKDPTENIIYKSANNKKWKIYAEFKNVVFLHNDSTKDALAWEDNRIYKTNDDGKTWEAIKGFPATINQVSVSPDYPNDKTIFLTTVNSTYKSVASIKKWNKITKIKNSNNMNQIIFSPDYPQTKEVLIYSDMWAETDLAQVPRHIAYRSTDSGRNWKNISKQIVSYNIISIKYSYDYLADKTIFLASPTIIYMSTDRGKNWKAIMGSKRDPLAAYDLGLTKNSDGSSTVYVGLESPPGLWFSTYK